MRLPILIASPLRCVPLSPTWLAACAATALTALVPGQVHIARPVPTQPAKLSYTVTDLGTLPASTVCRCFFGLAISNRAHVVGRFFGPTGNYHAFLWHAGAMTDLGSLGGGVTQVLAVNDQGVAAGLSRTLSGAEHAFVFQSGAMRDLGTLGGTHSLARAINSAGVAAGSAAQRHGRDEYTHAAVWAQGHVLDLGTLGGEFSEGFGINSVGQVVGWAWDPARRQRAFLWTPGAGMVDLGDLGGNSAVARAINDVGMIVGGARPPLAPETEHAVLWTNSGVRDLGLLPEAGRPGPFGPELVNTFAQAVNNAGQIVGNSYPGTPEPPLRPGPFLWQDGAMQNLNDLIEPGSGWVLMEANGINDRGQVVGTARRTTGEVRAVLLEPGW
jgi:probable HAF family extracellular repeat protein